jgi:hypothetical protein
MHTTTRVVPVFRRVPSLSLTRRCRVDPPVRTRATATRPRSTFELAVPRSSGARSPRRALFSAVTPRGGGSRILLDRGIRGTNRSNRQSGSNPSRRVEQKYPAREERRANSRQVIGRRGRDFPSEAEKTFFFFGPSRIRHLDRRGGRARAPTTRRVARPPRVTVSTPASEGTRSPA